MAACDDRAATLALPLPVRAPAAGACNFYRIACALGPRPPWTPAPHLPGQRTVCDNCWSHADPIVSDVEVDQMSELVVTRQGPPLPKYDVSVTGCLGLLCEYCVADEQEFYRRNETLFNAPPQEALDRWSDQCTCHHRMIRLQNGAPIGTPPIPARYCLDCRQNALAWFALRAQRNKNELRQYARAADRSIVTASPALIASRAANGHPIACRCGRETVEPTPGVPKVTYCLCCGGVQVDKLQVR